MLSKIRIRIKIQIVWLKCVIQTLFSRFSFSYLFYLYNCTSNLFTLFCFVSSTELCSSSRSGSFWMESFTDTVGQLGSCADMGPFCWLLCFTDAGPLWLNSSTDQASILKCNPNLIFFSKKKKKKTVHFFSFK